MRIFFSLLLFAGLSVKAQHQDLALLSYNTLTAGVGAGIGAIINHPRGISWKKAFVKDAGRELPEACYVICYADYAGKKHPIWFYTAAFLPIMYMLIFLISLAPTR